jgi:drug/metabolite transporter (DMT)-like permease
LKGIPLAQLKGVAHKETVGGLSVVLAATLFGCVVVLAKLISRSRLGVPLTLGVRFGICSILLAAMLVIFRLPVMPRRGERLGLIVLGTGFYSAEAALFFSALGHGEVATVTLLFFTYPMFMLLASAAIGHGAPGRLLLFSVFLAVLGAGVVVGTAGRISIDPIGILLVLCSALGYTGYMLVVHHWLRKSNSLTASTWITGGVALVLLLAAVVAGYPRVPPDPAEWLELLGMGGGTAGGIIFLFAGLRRIGPVRTSVLATMEPLAAAVLAVVALGEPLHFGTVVGGSLIVGGSLVAGRSRTATPLKIP